MPAKFVQIACSQYGNNLYALDEDGHVWKHEFLTDSTYVWVKQTDKRLENNNVPE